MSRRSDTTFLGVFGVALWMTGAWLFSKPFLDLPTRRPPTVIHLEGLPHVLFALGPVLAGVALGLAAWRVHKGGELRPDQVTRWETLAFLAGIASLIAGLLLGPRV
nr:hypothetical protein [uncultured Holophaga sp.]